MKTQHFVLSFFLSILIVLPQKTSAWFSLEIESGAAFQYYNDIRIPGDGGTFFSLTDDFNTPRVAFIRGRALFDIGERHTILLTAAPLTINGSGSLDEDLFFHDTLFNANDPLTVSWKFNSWRISYQYKLVNREKIDFSIGVTAKLRDAKIAVANDEYVAEKTDLGFVPIVRVVLDWKFHPKAGILLDADALVGPQGRAEDGILAFYYQFNETFRLYAGYRVLEGGADVDEVYNFSMTHFATGGIRLSF